MISFRERNNIDPDAKPHERRCVYCGRSYTTISGRLCCRDCVRRGPVECEKIFDARVEVLRNNNKKFNPKTRVKTRGRYAYE